MKSNYRGWQTALGTALCWVLLTATAQAGVTIQHWVSKSGAKVYFVENQVIPMLDIAVSWDAGSARDPQDKQGVAALTRALLGAGAQGLSEDDIARGFADVGAQFSGHAGDDAAQVSLRTLTRSAEREAALNLLAKVMQSPTFPQVVLDREIKRSLAGYREAATKPEFLLEQALSPMMYGGHPYGRVDQEKTLPNIRRNDVESFYRRHYGAANALVALMGAISRAEAEVIAERLTSGLPTAGKPAAIPAVTLPAQAGEKRIAHPASQAHIALGLPAAKRGMVDFWPLFVGNYILGGGGFDSRLTQEVRQQRGLVYSVYSSFGAARELGPFRIGLQTKREQADEALKVVREVLDRFIDEGPTEAELQQAKNNLIGGFPLRIDSNRKILDYLVLIGTHGLPLSYIDDFVGNVEQVTVADIRRAFPKVVDRRRLQTVVVGVAQ